MLRSACVEMIGVREDWRKRLGCSAALDRRPMACAEPALSKSRLTFAWSRLACRLHIDSHVDTRAHRRCLLDSRADVRKTRASYAPCLA